MLVACRGINSAVSVNGGYSDFGDWSPCTEICGEGIQIRTRTCTSPAPAHGGADCVGLAREERKCKIRECPGLNFVASASFLFFSHH